MHILLLLCEKGHHISFWMRLKHARQRSALVLDMFGNNQTVLIPEPPHAACNSQRGFSALHFVINPGYPSTKHAALLTLSLKLPSSLSE